MLQCVAVCCSVLQCLSGRDAENLERNRLCLVVRCSVSQCVGGVLQCVAMCCRWGRNHLFLSGDKKISCSVLLYVGSVLQCVGSVLQCVGSVLQCVGSVLQCAANVLPCAAVCCTMLREKITCV